MGFGVGCVGARHEDGFYLLLIFLEGCKLVSGVHERARRIVKVFIPMWSLQSRPNPQMHDENCFSLAESKLTLCNPNVAAASGNSQITHSYGSFFKAGKTHGNCLSKNPASLPFRIIRNQSLPKSDLSRKSQDSAMQ